MKILLANFSKMVGDTGGTAKVNCAFANEMKRQGHDVLIVFSDDNEGEFFFSVEPGIKCINLRHYKGKSLKLPMSYRIRRELVRGFSKKWAASINEEFTNKYLTNNIIDSMKEFSPDVIICFQPAAAKSYLCDIKTKIPVILMCHGDAEDWFHNYPDEQMPAIRDSRVVQVLMPSFPKAINKRFPDTRTEVIGNVVPQYDTAADLDFPKKKIVFIGHLARKHKRPHLLVDAFIMSAKEFPDWEVEIWGHEESRGYVKEMQNKIDAAGFSERIFIKGTTKDVESVYAAADIFVFPSAFEGFGLAVAEAMSKGLPVIAYKSCPAVNELVQDGVTGFLVDDGTAPIAEKLKILMQDKDLRIKMGAAGRVAMKEYSAEKIWNKWTELLNEVVGEEHQR